ncbi:rod shape-determining protein MreC [Desulfovibrio sp. OttesenSCG-928-F20]|nr:rod shape-determining protein MreC [Desulfovibrio sp. OttesenSCG-928-F20]
MLSPVVWVKDQCIGYWRHYMALVDVAEENDRLREDLRRARNYANLVAEERAELNRLRKLLQLETLRERPAFAARIIAWRFGPLAARNTFTVNKGYLDGAVVGAPVVTDAGVVGRVLRTAPHASTVLMITDSGFRLAVISQQSRTPGIVMGGASGKPGLEMAYVAQNARISPGELLITSGLDGIFPKGIAVGIVTAVTPGNEILFQQVHVQPMVELEHLEEVLLLQQASDGPPLLDPLPDPAEMLPLPLLPGGMLPGDMELEVNSAPPPAMDNALHNGERQ